MSTKKELEKREIKLESIVQAYSDLIDNFTREFPLHMASIARLENISMALFNAAEVRVDIEELVSFNFTYEEDSN